MAIVKQDSKMRIKRSTVADKVPDIGPSSDHTDGSWDSLDIYSGEFFLNETDERLFIGVGTGVKRVPLTDKVQAELQIGDWDMDATGTVAVAHGLSATEWKTIRRVSVIIRNDADTKYHDTSYPEGNSQNQIGITSFDPTNFNLERLQAASGGDFDSTDYDSTSYNRGWINFEYTPD